MNTGSVLAQFTIHLSVAVAEPVEVSWHTADGTAKAGVDYAAASGVAIFAPGQTTKTVDVLVYGRAVGSEDRSFFVEMLPPVNAILGAATGECIIQVDTTGSTPVTQVIVPTGPRGIQGKSAYQVWLDLGNTGTEQDFIDSLSPSPQEIAQEVAPLLNVGNSLVTAFGTDTLDHPDNTTVAKMARRIAYAGETKVAVVTLAAGDNLINYSDLSGDAVNFSSIGIYPRILRGTVVISPDWLVENGDKIIIKGAVDGDVLYICQYDLISSQSVKNTMEPIVSLVETQAFEALRRSCAVAGYNLVNGSFETSGTLVNTNDVLLHKATGKVFSGPSGYVVAGTNPASGVFKDLSNRISVFVSDIHELLTISANQYFRTIDISEYRSGTNIGGGKFKYSPLTPKSQHNGGTIISPTVPWDGSLTGLANFVNGVGETDNSGVGCYLRVCSDVKAEYFGCFKSLTESCAASWAAANLYAAKNHYELVMIDGPIFVDSTCVIDGATTNFRTVKLKGTFASTGVALNYTPDACGSVVMTHGAPAMRIKFNLFSNENYSIKGVGFIDSTYYPRGQPLRQYSPIELEKGNADGSSERYITGHVLEDVVFSGYEAGVEALGKGPTVPSNYIGPTSCRRVSTYNQGDVFRCIDSTMNHLWISDSNLFGLNGFGVNLVKTPGGPGGFADVTYSNVMIEGARGLLNTGGHGANVRSRLVLNSVNRESCGFYGPNESGLYTGNPLGMVVDTDIVIAGVWTDGVAFNEQSLPIAESGATVSSSVNAEFLFLAGAKNLTPDSVNTYDVGFDLAAGQAVSKTIIGVGTDAIDATVRVVLNSGRRGVSYANIYGYTTGTKIFERLGAKDALIDVVFSDGAPNSVCTVTVTNNSQSVTSVLIEVVNRSGMNTYTI